VSWSARLGLPDTAGQRPFLTAMLVDTLGSGAFYPFVFLYFRVTTDLSLSAIGLGITVANLLSIPLGPWFGGLTDRHGARPICLASNVFRASGLLAYLLVGSLPALVAATLLITIGDRAFWASYGTFVSEIAAPGQRQRWFGLLMSTRNLGLGLGALLGGAVVTTGPTGAHALALVDATSFVLCAALLTRVRTRRPPGRRDAAAGSWASVLRDRGYRGLTGANTLLTSGFVVLSFLPVYLVETLGLPGWLAGAAFTMNCALIVVLQTTSVRVTEGYRRTRVLAVASVVLASSSATFLAAGRLPRTAAVVTVVLGITLYTLGEILYSPAADALAAEAAPDELRGRYLSVYQLSWTASGTFGPVLSGVLLDAGSLPLWTVFAALVLLGGAAVLRAERSLPADALVPALSA
jgi:MFS family permease